MSPADRARDGYRRHFGEEPAGVTFVPGRVNLIGEHVDYNAGLVLPMPIGAGTAAAWGGSTGAEIEAVALDFAEARDCFVAGQIDPHDPVDWRSYLRGTAAGLIACGLQPGPTRIALAGSIPHGSGLSSSASLCVVIGRALTAAAGLQAEPHRLALAAQSAEHRWAGVRCGIMDQMAVAAGVPGSALLLDCADLSHRTVALPCDWAVMIVQSGVRRGLVDGHYNQRRADCETAAEALGLTALRQADPTAFAGAGLDRRVERRARHVIEEVARVSAAVAAIECNDLSAFGELLCQSHASLRDLFEVSEPNVDRLVDVLNAAIGGEGGARMTGGGFGGAVVAVLPRCEVARVRALVEARYAPPGGALLEIMIEETGLAPAGECE